MYFNKKNVSIVRKSVLVEKTVIFYVLNTLLSLNC